MLIIGGDSNLAVQTFKGYSHFLNLIYNSKFTETSYGVPITCSFSYANSHGLVETEFINTIHIEPLYVKPSREIIHTYLIIPTKAIIIRQANFICIFIKIEKRQNLPNPI